MHVSLIFHIWRRTRSFLKCFSQYHILSTTVKWIMLDNPHMHANTQLWIQPSTAECEISELNLGVWRNYFFPVSRFSIHCGWSLYYQVSTSCSSLQRRSSGLTRILSPRDRSLPHGGFQCIRSEGCPIFQAWVFSCPEICKFNHLLLTAQHSPRQNANPRGTQFISQFTCSEINLDLVGFPWS